IDLARGFVVVNRVVFTSEPFQHLGGVEISVQWTSGASESFVSLVDLAETTIGQAQVVENALISRRKLGCALQAIDGRAIVATLIERETEIVQRLSVFFQFHGALERLLRTITKTLLVVGNAKQVVRFRQLPVERHGQ